MQYRFIDIIRALAIFGLMIHAGYMSQRVRELERQESASREELHAAEKSLHNRTCDLWTRTHQLDWAIRSIKDQDDSGVVQQLQDQVGDMQQRLRELERGSPAVDQL